jgi:hypothetical protein
MTEVNPQAVKGALLHVQSLAAMLNMGGPAELLLEVLPGVQRGLARLQHEIEQAGPGARFTPPDTGELGGLLAKEQAKAIPDHLPADWDIDT